MPTNNTEQIYEIASQLVLSSRNISFPEYADAVESAYRTTFLKSWCDLNGQQRAFIATMLAMRSPGTEQTLIGNVRMKMVSSWFMSHRTYHKVRNELIENHVIAKLGSSYRFVLNPDFHPNLSSNVAEQLSIKFAKTWFKRYRSK